MYIFLNVIFYKSLWKRKNMQWLLLPSKSFALKVAYKNLCDLSSSSIMPCHFLISNYLHSVFPLPQSLSFSPSAWLTPSSSSQFQFTHHLSESLLWHPIVDSFLLRSFHSTVNFPNSLHIFNCQFRITICLSAQPPINL